MLATRPLQALQYPLRTLTLQLGVRVVVGEAAPLVGVDVDGTAATASVVEGRAHQQVVKAERQ